MKRIKRFVKRRYHLCGIISGGTIMTHIFLSHSDQDHVFIEQLQKSLELKGLEVWDDNTHIRTGDEPYLFSFLAIGIDKIPISLDQRFFLTQGRLQNTHMDGMSISSLWTSAAS